LQFSAGAFRNEDRLLMNIRRTIVRLLLVNLWLLIFAGIPGCCNSQVNGQIQLTGYDLSNPDRILMLPAILREISGLSEIDSSAVACIQDENGILFIYDVIKNQIRQQYVFHGNGDYEGITRVGAIYYILRSDGLLLEISGYQSGKPVVTSYSTGVPARDNEGLCYDQKNSRLLIACKSKIDHSLVDKDKRVIYGFDLKLKKLSAEPVIVFDLPVIRQFAVNNKISPPGQIKHKAGKAEPAIQLKISDLGIHPLTGKLFVLSAADHLLFIFDLKGTIEHIEKLNPLIFNKPEGITFFENGDMLISNEGQKGKPTVLRFNYKNKYNSRSE
jgi:hypothetical protein